jgi:Suppressor of fused protein (SUFU)
VSRRRRARYDAVLSDAQEAVRGHIRAFFAGHRVRLHPAAARVKERIPTYRALEVESGERLPLHTYVTLGCWDAVHDSGHGLEFALLVKEPAALHLLHLAMAAFYHCAPDPTYRLDHGHTVPIGEPWLPGSEADHFLVALPYPLGPDFEICEWDNGHARLLWLLPITQAEREFKAEHGLEALERRFDAAGIDFADPMRPSVA